MGVNKLDIEFEDDEEIQAREEAERKKNEVVEDVDLSFGAVESDSSEQSAKSSSEEEGGGAREVSLEDESTKEKEAKSPEPKKEEEKKPEPKKVEAEKPEAKVEPIERAREQRQVPAQEEAPVQQPQYQQIPQAQVMIGPDYKLGDELKKVAASNQILAIEIEARVKVEVAKEMTKTFADFHAQNKLLEHKINKILNQMHQKAPGIKNELMMIKKYLKEHSSLDEEDESSSESTSQKSSTDKRVAKKPVKKKAA